MGISSPTGSRAGSRSNSPARSHAPGAGGAGAGAGDEWGDLSPTRLDLGVEGFGGGGDGGGYSGGGGGGGGGGAAGGGSEDGDGFGDGGGGREGEDVLERAIRKEKAEQQVLRRRLAQVEARANELLAMVGEREDEVEILTAEMKAQELADKTPIDREPTVSGRVEPLSSPLLLVA